jgi:hypothetical protein
MALMKER